MSDITLTTTLKRRVADLPDARRFRDIYEEILGTSYDLSVVFVEEKEGHELNKKYRKKDYATNVLSFPLSETEGELILCIPIIEREAQKASISSAQHILYLFIHGCLHLKGYEHGSKMDAEEKRLSAQFIS